MVSSAILYILMVNGLAAVVRSDRARSGAGRWSLAGEGVPGVVEAPDRGAVVEVTADEHADPADDRRVNGDLQADPSTVHPGQLLGQALLGGLVQRRRHGDVRDALVALLRGEFDEPGQRPGERAAAEALERELGQ